MGGHKETNKYYAQIDGTGVWMGSLFGAVDRY